jgi:hypothetical protein
MSSSIGTFRPDPGSTRLARSPRALAALLDQVRAAATNVETANGLAALVQAMEPLNKVPALATDFTAEVKQTTGIS